MIEKQNRKSEGSGKRVLNPDLEGVQKASRTDESKNGEKDKAGGEARDGKKGSEGASREKNAQRRGVTESGGQGTKQASERTKEQAIPKAPEEVTKVVEEAKPSGTATPERQRQANGRFLPRPGAEGARKRTRTKNDGDGAGGSGHGGGASLMTETGQKRLVCRLLGRADKMANKDGFKLSAGDLIRLIQLQKEMTPRSPHKVTVQWVEDERE
jgi:hypothetical protein